MDDDAAEVDNLFRTRRTSAGNGVFAWTWHSYGRNGVRRLVACGRSRHSFLRPVRQSLGHRSRESCALKGAEGHLARLAAPDCRSSPTHQKPAAHSAGFLFLANQPREKPKLIANPAKSSSPLKVATSANSSATARRASPSQAAMAASTSASPMDATSTFRAVIGLERELALLCRSMLWRRLCRRWRL